MQKDTFARIVNDLADYYGETRPRDGQISSMMGQVRHLPDTAEAVEVLTDAVKKNCNALPSNLPKELNGFWFQWLSSHPQKFIVEKTPCKAFNGDGFIPFTRFIEELGRTYREICLCGHCENWRLSFAPGNGILRLSLTEIRARGWVPEIDKAEQANVIPGRGLKAMVAGIGQEVPF